MSHHESASPNGLSREELDAMVAKIPKLTPEQTAARIAENMERVAANKAAFPDFAKEGYRFNGSGELVPKELMPAKFSSYQYGFREADRALALNMLSKANKQNLADTPRMQGPSTDGVKGKYPPRISGPAEAQLVWEGFTKVADTAEGVSPGQKASPLSGVVEVTPVAPDTPPTPPPVA